MDEVRACVVAGCDRPHYGKGYCHLHWGRMRRNGHLEVAKRPERICSVDGCEAKHFGRGFCKKHHWRFITHGSPHSLLRQGGHVNERGYVELGVGGRRIFQHRYVMEQALGRRLERWETVHHKNGVRSDNRLANLELRIGQHGPGQSPQDVAGWLVQHYPDVLLEALAQAA